MSLLDVKFQAAAQQRIQRAVQRDRVPHAYIFHGPDGVGKELLALGLSQLLLCPNPVQRTLEPKDAEQAGVNELRIGCGACADCRMVMAETHPDCHLVYRQLNRDHPDPEVRKRKGLDIGVDVLRHFVIDRVGLTPARGQAKMFIIREADRVTPQAQNALLKTLEEPPGTTFIILLVSALDRLLATTQSRCQMVPFESLPLDFVRTKLAQELPALPAAEREWYARMSDGSLGFALEAAGDEWFSVNQRVSAELEKWTSNDKLVIPDPKLWTQEAEALGDRYRKRDPDITDTEATRRGQKTVFRLAAAWYADIIRTGGDAEAAALAIQRIVQAERQLDLNANPTLIVETLVNDLVRSGR